MIGSVNPVTAESCTAFSPHPTRLSSFPPGHRCQCRRTELWSSVALGHETFCNDWVDTRSLVLSVDPLGSSLTVYTCSWRRELSIHGYYVQLTTCNDNTHLKSIHWKFKRSFITACKRQVPAVLFVCLLHSVFFARSWASVVLSRDSAPCDSPYIRVLITPRHACIHAGI